VRPLVFEGRSLNEEPVAGFIQGGRRSRSEWAPRMRESGWRCGSRVGELIELCLDERDPDDAGA